MHIANVALPPNCSHLMQRALTLADLDKLLIFRQQIFAQLPDPDWVRPEIDEIQWARSRLAQNGACTGLFEPTGDLVAYASMYLPPGGNADDLMPLASIPTKSWSRVSIIDSCMVHPRYRGNGLQKALIRARFKTAEGIGRPLCVALTSPLNDVSRHNLMSCGLSVCWIGETALTLIRQVLALDLSAMITDKGPVIWVSAVDVEQQRMLTSAGYRGFWERQDSSVQIGYALPGAARLPKIA